MPLSISPDLVPITIDSIGVARVGGTRVRLDTVIIAYKLGTAPEEIARGYDTITLADVYGTIAYYLRHTADVDDYLHKREIEAAELRRLNESRIDQKAVRERLMARAAKLHTH